MSEGPFDYLNIYIHYGLRNLAFKNTCDDGPFLTPENFYKRYNIWCHNIWCYNIWCHNIWCHNIWCNNIWCNNIWCHNIWNYLEIPFIFICAEFFFNLFTNSLYFHLCRFFFYLYGNFWLPPIFFHPRFFFTPNYFFHPLFF